MFKNLPLIARFAAGRKYRASLLGAVAAGLVAFVVLIAAGCGEETKAATTTDLSVDTGGRLQISETVYDFGKAPVGQKVDHKFELKNTGTGPLKLGQMSVKRLEGC